MINTQTFLRSAYFEEVKESLVFLRRLRPIIAVRKMPFGKCKCLPTAPTVASQLGLSQDVVERGMSKLMRLKWLRKYKRKNKALFVAGGNKCFFMQTEIQKKFGHAQRKKNGEVLATEWQWIPTEKWSGVTLWAMIRDKLWEKGILTAPLQVKGRVQMQRLITNVGIVHAKSVGSFFAEMYPALKSYFKWYGSPNPGMFKGFFSSIKDIRERGLPHEYVDRSKMTEIAKEIVTDEWTSLEETL